MARSLAGITRSIDDANGRRIGFGDRLDAAITRGELEPVFDWLRTNIWTQGSRWTTEELAVRASGEPLNPAHFRAHLEARYLG